MELYIGGIGQGKLEYVRKIHPDMEDKIINDFHLLVRKMLLDGKNPMDEVEKIIKENPDAIIISDEIGNGIVPADEFERRYREETGRVLCKIARKSQRVERIICGIGQRLV